MERKSRTPERQKSIDRYILARSKDRETQVEKYKISQPSYNIKHYPKEPLALNLDKKTLKTNVYNSLLKSQLFTSSNSKEEIYSLNYSDATAKKVAYSSPNTVLFTEENSRITNNFISKKRKRSIDSNPNENQSPSPNHWSYKKPHTSFVNMLIYNNKDFSLDHYLETLQVKTTPIRVLDAPGLKDDYYLHLLDWSNDDLLTISLDDTIYIWETTGKVTEIVSYDKICSLAWLNKPNVLTIGLADGSVTLFDIERMKEIGKYKKHVNRIGVIAKSPNDPNLFSTGSLDSQIITYDIRQKSICFRFIGHKQEVCGLKWSPDGSILASGSNDNKLMLWKNDIEKPYHSFTKHESAIRALDWSHRKHNLLCSGGGIQDKILNFWNCSTMSFVDSIQTTSQVCNLAFSKHSNELISTHGFSENSICLWNLENKKQIGKILAHWKRVLYMAYSPHGKIIATGSGDETLRFWEVFKSNNKIVKIGEFHQPNLR